MSAAEATVEKSGLLIEGKPFASVAKKYKPKGDFVLAYQHKGTPAQYPTKDGTETAYDGDYVVEVGTVGKTVIVPPSVGKDGSRKPGEQRAVKEPLYEVMKRGDFESLYA